MAYAADPLVLSSPPPPPYPMCARPHRSRPAFALRAWTALFGSTALVIFFFFQTQPTRLNVGIGSKNDESRTAWLIAAESKLQDAPSTLPRDLAPLALLRWAVAVGEMAEVVHSKGSCCVSV